MGLRKKSRRSSQEVEPNDEVEAGQEAAAPDSPPSRENGPFDVGEVDDVEGYLDFGAVLVKPDPDLSYRIEQQEGQQQAFALTLLLPNAAVQLRVMAAPRSGGLWATNREGLSQQINGQGGRADEMDGQWGTELHAAVRVASEKGYAGMQAMRFVGVEGPRWLLQALFMGEGAEPAKAGPIEDVFRGLVVVRGEEAMPVGAQITFRAPTRSEPPTEIPQPPDVDSLEPGARITEVR